METKFASVVKGVESPAFEDHGLASERDKVGRTLEQCDEDGFEDYSITTHLEQLAATIEDKIRSWVEAGLDQIVDGSASANAGTSFASVSAGAKY